MCFRHIYFPSPLTLCHPGTTSPAHGTLISFFKPPCSHLGLLWPSLSVYNEAMLIRAVSWWVFFQRGERSWDTARGCFFLPAAAALEVWPIYSLIVIGWVPGEISGWICLGYRQGGGRTGMEKAEDGSRAGGRTDGGRGAGSAIWPIEIPSALSVRDRGQQFVWHD